MGSWKIKAKSATRPKYNQASAMQQDKLATHDKSTNKGRKKKKKKRFSDSQKEKLELFSERSMYLPGTMDSVMDIFSI